VVEAVHSVLQQTYSDLEIVVCDDGSTDDTAARVAAFGPPVRYLKQAHSGHPGSPRNLGIEAAQGELVAFLDDDDLWESDKLARQVALVDREELDLVYSDRRLQPSDGSSSAVAVTPEVESPDRLLDLVLEGQFPCICTVLVRRALLRQVEGFDETLATGEDLDLWLRLAPIARAGHVAEPLVLVRRQAGSLSDRSGAAAYLNAIAVLQRSLSSGDLRPAQRQRCRATLARLSGRLAAVLAGEGDGAGAVLAAFGALRHAPTSRPAWGALATIFRK
jgi:glycosyltransferase involved in cell wall biosynthesis